MGSRDALERLLQTCAGFGDPEPTREQYVTPPDVAAHLLHAADLRGDLDGGPVVDLGAGTGVLAIGAAVRGGRPVVGVEVDPAALGTAAANATRLDVADRIEWLRGDVRRLPLELDGATVLSNPPFGAQDGSEGADRPFLAAAAAIGARSYTIHNAGSEDFVRAFAADAGGTVTDVVRATLTLPAQFDFHTAERRDVPAEVYRIEWTQES